MKVFIPIIMFALGCANAIASQRLYVNILYCESCLTLYDNGRADWYDCELDEKQYGHYWQQNDTMRAETLIVFMVPRRQSMFYPTD